MRASSSAVTGAKCEKSKRSRSASTSEHLTQRRVQEVRCRVVAHRRRAPLGRDHRLDRIADAEPAAGHEPGVRVRIAQLLGVLDLEVTARARERTRIAHLTAALTA